MKRTRSLDDLKSAQLHFDKSCETQIQSMPQYLVDEKNRLDAVYADMEGTSKSRIFIGVQKMTDLEQSNALVQRAASALSRAKLYLRATAPDKVREYFAESNGASGRKIDHLHAICKVLTVSEHFGHAHLGSFKAELEALKTEGEAIFSAAAQSATEQKTEVERLKEQREKWEIQYQRLKFLFRGHFHGTSTDWSMFFSEKRQVRNGSGKGNGHDTASEQPFTAPAAS
jgi:23S rRNA G2069 N7-methylase RlmK/C1962 C5-methylase RlmI